MGAFLSGLPFLFFFGVVYYTLRYGQRATEPVHWGRSRTRRWNGRCRKTRRRLIRSRPCRPG